MKGHCAHLYSDPFLALRTISFIIRMNNCTNLIIKNVLTVFCELNCLVMLKLHKNVFPIY